MKLHEALDTFSDHVDDILDAVSSNLHEDIQQEVRDAQILGTGWVADEVRTIRHHNLFDERVRRLKRIAQYKRSLLTPPSPSRITDADIDRAKQHPIQDLYAGKLRKSSGKWAWSGKCELHNDSTASFYIDKKNRYHCFGCHAHGDAIQYYMTTRGATFIPAVKAL